MTRLLIIPVLLAMAITSCTSKQVKITIRNESSYNKELTIRMTNPVDGSFSFINCDTIRIDTSKTLFFPINNPAPIYIQKLGKRGIYILAERGESYEVVYDGSSLKVRDDIVQEKYNAVPQSVSTTSLLSEAAKFASCTTQSEIMEIISKQKNQDMSPFDSLLEQHKISRPMYAAIQLERDLYYRALCGSIAYRYFMNSGSLNEEFYNIWDSALKGVDMSNPKLAANRYYYALAQNYADFLMFSNPNLDMDELMAKVEEGKIHTVYTNLFKDFLKGKNLEYMIANRLFNACFQRDYSKELIDIFEDFQANFPNSKYLEILNYDIDKIKDFHHKALLSEQGIEYIKNYPSINSFEELIKLFRGKKVYVDVWATWCAPCKDEFKYANELYALLEQKGYEALFISIDKDENNKKWNEMIQGFALKGKHIRANEHLYKDLHSMYNNKNTMEIPWNMIVDEDGNIKEKYAKRPSEIGIGDL